MRDMQTCTKQAPATADSTVDLQFSSESVQLLVQVHNCVGRHAPVPGEGGDLLEG